jgi:hypothetical protein
LYRRRSPGPIVSVQPVPSLPPHWHTREVIAGTVPATADGSLGNEKGLGAVVAAEARGVAAVLAVVAVLMNLSVADGKVGKLHARETLTLPSIRASDSPRDAHGAGSCCTSVTAGPFTAVWICGSFRLAGISQRTSAGSLALTR